NRVVMIIDPANGVTATSYDAHDRPTRVTDPNGNTTTYVYDGFGDVIQQTSPDTGTTIYVYDLAGNLVQRVDAAGTVTNHSRDALDRVVTTTYPANASANVAYSYDESGHGFGIGRLTTVTDAVGTVSYIYDGRGNVLRETRTYRSKTLVTSYTYDAANWVASITYPSGLTVAYSRDAMGRVTAMTAHPPAPVIPNAASSPLTVVSAV